MYSKDEFTVEWHQAPLTLFHAEDSDEDGFISWEEFEGPKGEYGPRGSKDLFSRLDADDDGRYMYYEREFDVMN